jgi:4-hydroxybenzoate polyprenyltransferase
MRLARVSMLPTALSNVVMGAVVAGAFAEERPAGFAVGLLMMLAASSCLYTAGMILNDVMDLARDRIERPERVLPAGRINVRSARRVGWMLLVAGVALTAVQSLAPHAPASPERLWALAVGLTLAGAIVAYNAGVKRTPEGPAMMGLCRALNVLLGVTAVSSPLQPASLYIATCIGLYVAGITWFASKEHERGARGRLLAAAMVMGSGLLGLLALALLAWQTPLLAGADPGVAKRSLSFAVLLLLVMVPALRRVANAIASPEPDRVQAAVIACLLSLIMIDASLCHLFAPHSPLVAAGVALLLIPAVMAGRWIRGT